MIKYIKENLTPLLIGYLTATIIYLAINEVTDLVLKIALINQKHL